MLYQLFYGDLAKIKADAIVISVNQDPYLSDGVDHAIYEKAGEKALLSLRKMIGKIEIGEAIYTRAISLKATYIIHTVSPMWRGGNNNERELLRNCFKSCLTLAKKLGCRSIAFPLIGTGVGRIPKKEAFEIADSEFNSFLVNNSISIYLVIFDEKTLTLTKKLFPQMSVETLSDSITETWSPSDHNLYVEQKYIPLFYEMQEQVNKMKKGTNRTGINYAKGQIVSMLFGFVVSEAVSFLDDINSTYKKYNLIRNDDNTQTSEKIHDIIISRIIYRVLKYPREPHELAGIFIRRICSDLIILLTGRNKVNIDRNFNMYLKMAIEELSKERLNITKEDAETDESFYIKCISLLNQQYNSYNDNRLLLIEAYYNKTCTNREIAEIVDKVKRISNHDKWDQLYIIDPLKTSNEVIERLDVVVFELINRYIFERERSNKWENQQEFNDFYKIKNYVKTHPEDWLYCLIPSNFRGMPYDDIVDRYKGWFPIVFLELSLMLKVIGMNEDFEVYRAYSPKNHDNGIKLITLIFELQCNKYAKKYKEHQIRAGFLSLFGE